MSVAKAIVDFWIGFPCSLKDKKAHTQIQVKRLFREKSGVTCTLISASLPPRGVTILKFESTLATQIQHAAQSAFDHNAASDFAAWRS